MGKGSFHCGFYRSPYVCERKISGEKKDGRRKLMLLTACLEVRLNLYLMPEG